MSEIKPLPLVEETAKAMLHLSIAMEHLAKAIVTFQHPQYSITGDWVEADYGDGIDEDPGR